MCVQFDYFIINSTRATERLVVAPERPPKLFKSKIKYASLIRFIRELPAE